MLKKRRWRRFQSSLLCAVCAAALLIQPDAAYGTEVRQPREGVHTHQDECMQLVCGLEEGDGRSRDVTRTGIASPSNPDPDDTGTGHTHTSECREPNCGYGSGKDGTGLTGLPKGEQAAETPRFVVNLATERVLYKGEQSATLKVEAEVEDGGTIIYEWYQESESEDEFGLISNGDTYTVARSDVSYKPRRYYVRAINEFTDSDGTLHSAEAKSNIIKVSASDQNRPTTAQKPVFQTDLTDLAINRDDPEFSLQVEAVTDDGGTITYDWYQGGKGPGSFTKVAEGDTTGSYTADTDTLLDGNRFFYVVAYNTITSPDGTTHTADTKSATAEVTIITLDTPVLDESGLVNASYIQGETADPLRVGASVTDGGTLSYQWYQQKEGESSGTQIGGADGVLFRPPTGQVGTISYYVVVTNHWGGLQQEAVSRQAVITVKPSDSSAPVLDESGITDATYILGETASALRVGATVTNGGTLSYQWYERKEGESSGTPIDGANGVSFTPPIGQVGVTSYYVVVTSHLGDKEWKVSSRHAVITVLSVFDTPVLDESGIVSATYTQGEAANALRVGAIVTNGGTLSYQWYEKKEGESSGAPVDGASGTSFTPSTSEVGVRRYYVVVTNRLGGQEWKAVSRQAAITVKPASGSGPNLEISKSYNTPYMAKQAVLEMLANSQIQLRITDTSISGEWMMAETDFDMAELLKRIAGLQPPADGRVVSVILPTEELSGSLSGNHLYLEYRLTFQRATWESGEMILEILLDKEFLKDAGKNRDIRILCLDENGKGLYALTLSGRSIAEMASSQTGLFGPDYSWEGVKIRLQYRGGTTALASIEGFDRGVLGIGEPVD